MYLVIVLMPLELDLIRSASLGFLAEDLGHNMSVKQTEPNRLIAMPVTVIY